MTRWLRARGIGACHPCLERGDLARASPGEDRSTQPLPRRSRVELLKRAFLGWLRGGRDHCRMAANPALETEDARRPGREREKLVGERTRLINRV